MKPMKKILAIVLLLTLLLIPAQPAAAKGMLDGQVIFGENFTLKSGETLNGDLVVFGGNVTVEEDALLDGSLVVIGGNITVDGTVESDMVIIGGTISLNETAIVKGDVVSVGGVISRADGAVVEGDVVENNGPSIQIPDVPNGPNVPNVSPVRVSVNPFASVFQLVFQAIGVAALAMLLVLFMQPQLERVSRAVVANPLIPGSVGMLVVFLAPLALLLMVVTLLLIPVALVAALLLVLAWLFGVIAIGMEVGERFTQAIHQDWAPVLKAGFGTLLLMLVVGGVGFVPCVGWLAPFLVGLTGIGAVTLTLFGSRVYPPPAPVVEVPPAS
ncbi:MAG: hypothetical protein ACOYZ8_17715 [Chloroflexota bacterium]